MIGRDKDASNNCNYGHRATPKRFVEIDDGRQACTLELYLLQPGTKKTSLAIEDFQKTRTAFS